MYYINIIESGAVFQRQLDQRLYPEYCFHFNSREDRVWDMVVLYENVYEIFNLKCKIGGRVFISGEPPIVKCYSPGFLDQFDWIISAHDIKRKNHIRSQQALPWYFGYDYDLKKSTYSFEEIASMDKPVKNNRYSAYTTIINNNAT